MATTASKLVALAKKQIGIKESGKGNVKYNTAYYGGKVSGDGFDWCCTFVWWLFRELNSSSIFYYGKKTAYVPNLVSWAKEKGLNVDKSKGKAGDIILFDFNGNGTPDHVGIIVKKNSNGSYTTIEGNTSSSSQTSGGCVEQKNRGAYIHMIIRPAYKKVSNPVQKLKKTYAGFWPKLPSRGYLKRGDTGTAVGRLQKFLNWCLGLNLAVDKVFGPATEAAVEKFQKKYGLTVDGLFGTKSLAKAKTIKK